MNLISLVYLILYILDPDCAALENFEALMALGNLATLNEAVR